MNRNSILLRMKGSTTVHTEEYLEQRNTIKKLEAALASVDLASKTWHTATVELGRTLELLCDALVSLQEVHPSLDVDDDAHQQDESANTPRPAEAPRVDTPIAAHPPSSLPLNEQPSNATTHHTTDRPASRAHSHDSLEVSSCSQPVDPEAGAAERQATTLMSSDVSAVPAERESSDAHSTTNGGAEATPPSRHSDHTTTSPPPVAVDVRVAAKDETVEGQQSVQQQSQSSPAHRRHPSQHSALLDARANISVLVKEFAKQLQQDVVGPLLTVTNEFRSCDALRHKRNRAQEQFEVDKLQVEKKIAEYEKKEKPLSESKRYADLFVARQNSEAALEHADQAFKAAYEQLIDHTYLHASKFLTTSAACLNAQLFASLKEEFDSVAKAGQHRGSA